MSASDRVATATSRFASVLAAPSISLAEAALCIAECARGGVDLDEARAELERIAAAVEEDSLPGVITTMDRMGFHGNEERYDDPRNSLLDLVLSRRTGIPITLSVVAIDVAARRGIDLLPVGMPGHFLVRAAADPDQFGDPFHARVLDRDGCRQLFEQLFGARRPLGPNDLDPVPAGAVLARMLNNLAAGRLGRDLTQLSWMVELHRRIPDLVPGDRVALATRLDSVGRYPDAAQQLDLAAECVAGDVATRLAARAAASRARLN